MGWRRFYRDLIAMIDQHAGVADYAD